MTSAASADLTIAFVIPEFASDFSAQFVRTKTLWRVENPAQFFPGARTGFLSCFIRFALSKEDRKLGGAKKRCELGEQDALLPG